MTHEQFKRIWIPLNPSFYKVAFHFLESEDEAKDAVQDLYIKLWNSKDSLDHILNPRAYGLTLLRNICIDRLRQLQSHRNEKVTPETAATAESDSVTIGKEEVRRLNQALDRLPRQYSEVIRYRFFKDMEIKDISRITGLSQVNIRVMISRARQTLKILLKPEIQ